MMPAGRVKSRRKAVTGKINGAGEARLVFSGLTKTMAVAFMAVLAWVGTYFVGELRAVRTEVTEIRIEVAGIAAQVSAIQVGRAPHKRT